MEGDESAYATRSYCTEGCMMCHIRRIEERLTENKPIIHQDYLKPSKVAREGCVVCEKVDTGVTLLTSESRGFLTQQLQVLAEDIRRRETRLAEDNPLFVHQDCLKPSTLLGLASER